MPLALRNLNTMKTITFEEVISKKNFIVVLQKFCSLSFIENKIFSHKNGVHKNYNHHLKLRVSAYLGKPRFHFSGQFVADTTTANNIRCQYDTKNFCPVCNKDSVNYYNYQVSSLFLIFKDVACAIGPPLLHYSEGISFSGKEK